MQRIEKILQPYKQKLKDRGHRDFQIFIDSDPTENKKYVRWIVDSYLNGGINRDEDLLARLNPALTSYEYLKSRNILATTGEKWQQETNIDNFCGLIGCSKKGFEKPGIEDLIDKYKDELESDDIKDANTAVEIFNGNEIRIIKPTTKQDACYYGQGTRWCTAATKGPNMFDNYSKFGPLYIIIPKHPDHVGEKYQLSFETGQYMNEHDEAVGLKFLLDRYPEIYQSKLNKYLIALADSDLDDAENATYNLKRSIDEDNFEIFKIIHAKYPDLDYKFSFDYVHSVVFFDYYTNVLQIPFDCVNNMNIIRSAIEFYKDDLLDKIWGKCDPNEVPDILNTIRKDVFSFDNLYAFKKLSELIDPENLMIAIESNAPKILEYLLTQNIEIKYKEDVIESLLANIENVYIGENFVQEEADKYKKRTSQIVSLLDQDGLLDRDFIKEYILENIDDKMEDMVKLLNYISFDSRTQLEISAAFDTAMTPKLDLLKKLARKAVE